MSISKPDQSTKVSTDAELTDQDLDNVTGGAGSDYLLTLDGIKGESTDDKHKDTIQISSFRKP